MWQNGVSNPSMSGTMTVGKIPVDNALNPAWREAAVHIITSQQWNDTLPDSIVMETVKTMTYDKGYTLRQLAPDSGAYYNEVCRPSPAMEAVLEVSQLRDPCNRPTPSSQIGNGHFGVRTMLGSISSNKNMTQKFYYGASIAWGVRS
jgi:hypothetical protein